ncbi:hypothetical protein WJX73_005533 [Symbiochloris irregularis]|uniref:Uncharacterized protein n=1 Tax=Symbiochloris irregularis TaxID=706552 RepID=A0AAW1NKR4_9CHLO
MSRPSILRIRHLEACTDHRKILPPADRTVLVIGFTVRAAASKGQAAAQNKDQLRSIQACHCCMHMVAEAVTVSSSWLSGTLHTDAQPNHMSYFNSMHMQSDEKARRSTCSSHAGTHHTVMRLGLSPAALKLWQWRFALIPA